MAHPNHRLQNIKMIAFGLWALTLETVHGMFLDKESKLLKNTNSLVRILMTLVCTQTTTWRDVHLYWETPREVSHAWRPSDPLSSPSLPKTFCARDPSPVTYIISVPSSSSGPFPLVCKHSINSVIPSRLSAPLASLHSRTRTTNSPPSIYSSLRLNWISGPHSPPHLLLSRSRVTCTLINPAVNPT